MARRADSSDADMACRLFSPSLTPLTAPPLASIKDHTPSAVVPVGPNVMEAHMEYVRTKYPDVYIRQPTEKSSYVYLSNNNAAGLFDEVKAYREENPDKNMNDAVHHFST